MLKMAKVKELHLCKNLDDLEKHSVIPDVRTKKIQMLLETARKLYREAEKFYCEGDEELAYVFYTKYFNLLNSIHKKPEYALHKQAIRQTLGDKRTNELTMDRLEALTKSLSERYTRLSSNNVKKPREEVTQTSTTTLTNQHASSEYTSGSITPTNENINFLSVRLINCKQLFDHMIAQNVLVMDCRSSADYALSHLSYLWAFNVPEEDIAAGMSAGKLQDKLDNESKKLWSARSIKEQIVLMDWNCNDAQPEESSAIAILLDILQNWDPDVTYRSPIKILEGGYEYFIMMYPTYCTNPSVQAPQQSSADNDLIDDIEYPSIYDITMKDEIRDRKFDETSSLTPPKAATTPSTAARPHVDRSSKQAAIKTYDEKQKPIDEIVKEQEALLEKAQANDEQLQQVAKQWNNIYDKKHLTASEQQLLYNMMQLESAAEDYKIENIRLREELEKYKRREQEQQANKSAQVAEDVAETAKKIEAKIEERERLDEQLERERELRAQQLALARENKRHLQPPTTDEVADEDEEAISKPKIPQFDRSIKPNFTTPAAPPSSPHIYALQRQRDFSPVPGAVGRGLTGLKNLGNTCYMNSILQCLSNTPQLTEYCITDKYKNYISRENKTKGHIVEEVAALIKVLWNGNYKCVASKDLRYVIGQYQQMFRGIEQQDSHEFLTILMDWLHSDLQTLPVPEHPRDTMTASEKAWLDFTKSKESLILHLFYGQIKSIVKCATCDKESATYECFSNLSLELPSNGNVCYLSQCMDMYFSGERIHGWNCPSCKQKRDAIKKLNISKLPPVLVVHLKRFYADPDTNGPTYKKKQNYLRFPLENLDMSPYITISESRRNTPKTYQLYGVSNHYGSMESGHYTAFCKSGNYGRWFKFDDQVVTSLDPSNVVSSAAYILFYTRLPPTQILGYK